MKRVRALSTAALAALGFASVALAQSGEFTEADCIKDLMQNQKVTMAVPDNGAGTTTLRTVDLNNDGIISLEEARKACSGADRPNQ